MTEALNGCRILVVEDEMLIMMQTTDLLADLGCVSMAAATIPSALALIAALSLFFSRHIPNTVLRGAAGVEVLLA